MPSGLPLKGEPPSSPSEGDSDHDNNNNNHNDDDDNVINNKYDYHNIY